MPRSSAPARQTILDAAYRLFRRKGFVRASMDEIAASAGVTKRTLYYHFASKDTLLAEVLEAQHALALAAFRIFGEGLAGSPEAIIDQLFRDLAVWSHLADLLAKARVKSARERAREIWLLSEGAICMILVHGDRSYASAAAEAAKKLVRSKSAVSEWTRRESNAASVH